MKSLIANFFGICALAFGIIGGAVGIMWAVFPAKLKSKFVSGTIFVSLILVIVAMILCTVNLVYEIFMSRHEAVHEVEGRQAEVQLALLHQGIVEGRQDVRLDVNEGLVEGPAGVDEVDVDVVVDQVAYPRQEVYVDMLGVGTGLSIMISKRNPSLVTTFALLSCGYIFSSMQEVNSVVLCTLSRARFSVAVESFLKTGYVPSLKEGNSKENIFSFPWSKDRPIVLGPRFKDAFQVPASFLAIVPIFEREGYIVTYNPSKGNVCALIKDQAKSDDILKAAFHAYVLHFIQASNRNHSSRQGGDLDWPLFDGPKSTNPVTVGDIEAQIAESCKVVSNTYVLFKEKAAEQVTFYRIYFCLYRAFACPTKLKYCYFSRLILILL